ncbi:SUR7/PalI family-domain-containing protein [Calycina marina]|uniref:SUR7/PalI family-domain-containing protein n=1 Tax=Calycina marina TaxID=1763456 RepID=A0A9P8CJG8_9HELO|nr:SUR7/PalI family-domain-containing protein [Calycina marina]
MAATGIIHHIGTFLLFASAILLLITTISSPVVNDISLLKVDLQNSSSITFGTFGYCVRDVVSDSGNENSKSDYCTGKHIGYNPAGLMENVDNTDFNTASTETTKVLTRVMVLHPICCGLAFIAFLLALGAGICGGLLASLTAALTWALTLVVLVTDFVFFGILKSHINDTDDDQAGSHASFGIGIWTLLAATILLFFASIIVFLACCSARRHKKSARVSTKNDYGTTTTKRHFWQRRTRY